MPVYQQKNISESIQIGMWKIEESLDHMLDLAQLQKLNIDDLPAVNNSTRKLQWLATRLLVKTITTAKIQYDNYGKPYLDNGWNLSISHASEFVAVIINKNDDCGIDIELLNRKIDKIKHKYLSNSDLGLELNQLGLTIYWSAKEALYKYYGKKEVLFIENLFIENYLETSSNFTGIIKMPGFSKTIAMKWHKIEDYVLVYTV